MELKNFPHNQLLNSIKVKIKPIGEGEDIKISIAAFEKQFKGWQIQKSPKALLNLMAQSRIIAQHIYNYFVEDGEESLAEGAKLGDLIDDINKNKDDNNNPPASSGVPNPGNSKDNKNKNEGKEEAEQSKKISKDEQALKTLFEAGKISGITKADLSGAGFEVGFFSTIGSKGTSWIGSYRLVRENNNSSVISYAIILKS